jgi:hypothetical protein
LTGTAVGNEVAPADLGRVFVTAAEETPARARMAVVYFMMRE